MAAVGRPNPGIAVNLIVAAQAHHPHPGTGLTVHRHGHGAWVGHPMLGRALPLGRLVRHAAQVQDEGRPETVEQQQARWVGTASSCRSGEMLHWFQGMAVLDTGCHRRVVRSHVIMPCQAPHPILSSQASGSLEAAIWELLSHSHAQHNVVKACAKAATAGPQAGWVAGRERSRASPHWGAASKGIPALLRAAHSPSLAAPIPHPAALPPQLCPH